MNLKVYNFVAVSLIGMFGLAQAETPATPEPNAPAPVAATPVAATPVAATKESAFEQYANIVDFNFVKDYTVTPPRQDVMIIDTRPARKFNNGHLTSAVNLSQTQFKKNIGKLPSDKNMLLIFYCGGLQCPLSHKAARQAEAAGYTNIKVYAAGYPDWVKNTRH